MFFVQFLDEDAFPFAQKKHVMFNIKTKTMVAPLDRGKYPFSNAITANVPLKEVIYF